MRRLTVVAALTLVLAPAAYGGHNPNHPANPAQTCRALRQTDQAAFQRMFGTRANAFGKCVSFIAKTRRQGQNGQAQSKRTNASRTCRALRALDTSAFEQMFRNFGKCVSTVGKNR